jgi:hypothetical protein
MLTNKNSALKELKLEGAKIGSKFAVMNMWILRYKIDRTNC